MSEHAFGRGEPFTVGVEEELLLVDPRSHLLAHDAERVVAAARARETVDYEAYAAEVELRSRPRPGASEAIAELARARAAVRAGGATLLGAGLHPAAEPGDVRLVEHERYRRVEAEMRGLIRRTPECALHVHVGMPDPEAALRALDALTAHLPVLMGLAAASPFWFGRDSGMASARAALVRAYPGRGLPPACDSFDEYLEELAAVAAGGGPPDYTLVWWDVRLHPRLGTVEVRELDAQARLHDVAALAALVQGMARAAAERAAPGRPPAAAIHWSCFRAARDGIDAEVLYEDRLWPLRDAARAAVALATPHVADPGALAGIDRILCEGGGAARQRAAHREGGMPLLLRRLVEETAAPLSPA